MSLERSRTLERYLWHCVHVALLAPHIKKSGRVHLAEIGGNLVQYIYWSIKRKTMKLPRIDAIHLPSKDPESPLAAFRLRWPLCTLLLSHGKNEEGDRQFKFGISYQAYPHDTSKSLVFSVVREKLAHVPIHFIVKYAYGVEASREVFSSITHSSLEDHEDYSLDSTEESMRLCYQYLNPSAKLLLGGCKEI